MSRLPLADNELLRAAGVSVRLDGRALCPLSGYWLHASEVADRMRRDEARA